MAVALGGLAPVLAFVGLERGIRPEPLVLLGALLAQHVVVAWLAMGERRVSRALAVMVAGSAVAVMMVLASLFVATDSWRGMGGRLLYGTLFGVVSSVPALWIVQPVVETLNDPSHDGPDWLLGRAGAYVAVWGGLWSLVMFAGVTPLGLANLLLTLVGVAALAISVERRWNRLSWWLRVSWGEDESFFVAPVERDPGPEVLPLLHSLYAGEVVMKAPPHSYRASAQPEPVALAPYEACGSRRGMLLDAVGAAWSAVLGTGLAAIVVSFVGAVIVWVVPR
jgi:hypothetical protein